MDVCVHMGFTESVKILWFIVITVFDDISYNMLTMRV